MRQDFFLKSKRSQFVILSHVRNCFGNLNNCNQHNTHQQRSIHNKVSNISSFCNCNFSIIVCQETLFLAAFLRQTLLTRVHIHLLLHHLNSSPYLTLLRLLRFLHRFRTQLHSSGNQIRPQGWSSFALHPLHFVSLHSPSLRAVNQL